MLRLRQEKNLVSLATIFAMKPDAFLLDESTSGIDEETAERINALLNRFSTSYIIISQDRGVLNRTTQSMYRMAIGRLEIIIGS